MTDAASAREEHAGPRARRFATQEEFEAFRQSIWDRYTHRFGEWEFNWCTRRVRDGERMIVLAEREADFLVALIDALPGGLTGSQLVAAVERANGERLARDTGRVYVRRLRRRVGAERIATTGYGYAFVPFPGEEP